uniref:Uncharacterized protein n=1 Tax=Drosophila melanogaster TaxID=7227 RepID=Q9VZ87_DROME|nr:uncharacterized protein Dmel_CG13711 [Drosophila melanogaster]AAF47938.1 uncharacterized protein Dmel_CG13711 [Drosophila melanogaster]|eukprot:NP_647928.1 uncharacterized protein Dmel_CG13711 [Drosophila melanogaster]
MPRYQKLINECDSKPAKNAGQQEQQQHCYQQQPKGTPNVGYHLYLYRQQLSQKNVEYMRLSKAKYFITDTLLAKTVRNLKGYSADELKTVNHQIVFRHKLRRQIQRLRKLRSLGIKNANPKMESTEL